MIEAFRHLKELPIYVRAFEHVFPGNNFQFVRKGSPLEYAVFFLVAALDFNYVSSIMLPNDDKMFDFIHRIPFIDPSRLTISHYLGKATKLLNIPAPNYLKSALMEGEIFGGTIETKTSLSSRGIGGKNVLVTGVMDDKRKPIALIAHKVFKKSALNKTSDYIKSTLIPNNQRL